MSPWEITKWVAECPGGHKMGYGMLWGRKVGHGPNRLPYNAVTSVSLVPVWLLVEVCGQDAGHVDEGDVPAIVVVVVERGRPDGGGGRPPRLQVQEVDHVGHQEPGNR